MYAKGNMVPGYGPMMVQSPPPSAYADPNLTRAVQVQLHRLGYIADPPDGTLGPRTVNAINTFERTAGLPINGVPSEQLLARLQATP
jgi:peptidoglycan hydrolase-like protein with peptidoglycan-binding domain